MAAKFTVHGANAGDTIKNGPLLLRGEAPAGHKRTNVLRKT